MSFVHLHNHTDYSLLDGAATIERYIEKAQETGMTSLAITDHGNMFGAIEFYKMCRKAGINPIIGCEFCISHSHEERANKNQHHLIALAMSDKGYHNLMKLSSFAYKGGLCAVPCITHDVLESHNEELIVLSAGIDGEVAESLLSGDYEKAKHIALWYKGVFGDRYYLEIQDHCLADEKKVLPLIKQLSDDTDIPLVCTNDIHYIEKKDWEVYSILSCIKNKSKETRKHLIKYKNGNYYFRTPEEMGNLFSWCPEAVENSGKIAERCHLEISFPGPVIPKYQIPSEFKDSAEYLTYLANEGLKKRYDIVTTALKQKFDYELGIIIEKGFADYFLIVYNYVHWAKTNDILVGPGRGKAGGSLVAYAMAITDIDPIKYDLIFEPFLNLKQNLFPDLDLGICIDGQKQVIEYVAEHYGKNKVGQIAQFNYFTLIGSIRAVAKVLGFRKKEIRRICNLIPNAHKITLERAYEYEPRLAKIEKKGGVYSKLFNAVRKIERTVRGISASEGRCPWDSHEYHIPVTIGANDLKNYVPLYADCKTDLPVTQYSMSYLSDCGLIKFDFFGLEGLTLIKRCAELVKEHDPDFDINKIDENDTRTFDLLCRGDTKHIFEFGNERMAKILRKAQPRSISELAVLYSLCRPIPDQFIDRYLDLKSGCIPIDYPAPCLEDVLEETYGLIVYQEQVIRIAQIIAGYTPGHADNLRRILGKRRRKEIEAEKILFRKGASENGFTEKTADTIFHILESCAGYSFMKAHAVAYSIIAYKTAFLKANYPKEFKKALDYSKDI